VHTWVHKMKQGKRRDVAQLARDRKKIGELYLRGWLQADIAQVLKLNQSTISRDLKALHREWLASALADFSKAKAQELAKIDDLEREYWRAWERSCEDAETVRKEGTTKVLDKIVKTAKGQAGDPRFLSGVQWCIERRCKILGIDAPEQHEHGEMTIKVVYDNSHSSS